MKPIIIIGAGIAGLATALKAIEYKKNIIVIERYSFFSRNHSVFLNESSLNFLANVSQQVNSLKKFAAYENLIEQFNLYYEQLITHINQSNKFFPKIGPKVPIKSLQTILLIACVIAAKAFKVNFIYKSGEKYKLNKIDIENSMIELFNTNKSEKEKIPFLLLFDATGTRRATLDYSASWTNPPKILKSNHTFNCFSAIMKGEFITQQTSDIKALGIEINKVGSVEFLNDRFNLNPKINMRPVGFGCGFFLKKNNKARLYMAGSLPDGLPDEQIVDYGKMRTFFSTKLGMNFELAYKNPEQSKNQEKRKVKNESVFRKFKTFVSAVDKPVYYSSSGKPVIVYIGDSRLTHIFFCGLGANEAFQDAIKVSQCLSAQNDNFNAGLFLQLIQHDFKATEKYESEFVEEMKNISFSKARK